MSPGYATIRLCSGRGGYEAIPREPWTVDLSRARRELEADGVRVTDARVLLIAALEPEVTLSRNGRILIKTRDREAAERAFEYLCRRLKLGPEPPSATR